MKFEGEFTEGIRNGKGTLYLTNGEKIEGSWLDGKLYGEAVVFKVNGTVLQGTWEDNRRTSLTYEGEVKSGVRDGDGIAYGKGGLPIYKGSW